MVKTGATKLWQRLPIHLSTTLSNATLTPNVVFYSDFPTTIASHPVTDVLANASSQLKNSPDFQTWHGIRRAANDDNWYLDQQGEEATYIEGAWRLDKYKFVPMVAHAARNYPGKAWYVFMEDDTFYFWESLYAWLASFDPAENVYVGGPASRLGEDFAHGGSGFALSRGAMEKAFGGAQADAKALTKWDEYSLEHGCGDHILSHVLASKGVKRRKDFDGTGLMPMQALPLWQLPFGGWDWCSPLFTVHKVHAQDVSMLWEWEKEFKAKKGGSVRYKDVFADLVEPKLSDVQVEWDNFSDEKRYSATLEDSAGETLTDQERSAKPWFNKAACEKACHQWDKCLQWRYIDNDCYHSSVVKQGRRINSGIKMTSGWMLQRIKRLREKDCDALPWPEL
ncbi:hypothetical protein DBV05_g10259 [Lasiodiplodia theobromae]|uniref:N-acetylgalactosaminide beta-1,3-galactosyltransferase n=1 Tax=Lasiodiplodia theobromae TaxID=45133 RepID=A0A5N5D0A0_9PEZI|nr:hypothetical protein DBV05_g10259 [Lasiodiplodia theobromae]